MNEQPPAGARKSRSGTLLLVGAALSFSLGAVSVKLIESPVDSPQLVLVRSLFMVAVVGVWARLRGEPVFLVGRAQRPLLLLRGVLGTVGFLLFFAALTRIPLADTVIIFQAHPLVVAMVSPFILGERPAARQWLFVCTSIAGVALVVGPSGEGSWAGRLMALGCAFTTGIAMALVRRLRRDLPALTVALAFPVIACLTVGPAVALGAPGFGWVPLPPRDLALLCGLCVFGTAGQVLVTTGLGRVPAARGSALSNLQAVFAVIFGVLLLGERPAWTTLAGAAVIITSLVLLALTARRKGGPTKTDAHRA